MVLDPRELKQLHDVIMDSVYDDELFRDLFCRDCIMVRHDDDCPPCSPGCLRAYDYFRIEEAVHDCAKDILIALYNKD